MILFNEKTYLTNYVNLPLGPQKKQEDIEQGQKIHMYRIQTPSADFNIRNWKQRGEAIVSIGFLNWLTDREF